MKSPTARAGTCRIKQIKWQLKSVPVMKRPDRPRPNGVTSPSTRRINGWTLLRQILSHLNWRHFVLLLLRPRSPLFLNFFEKWRLNSYMDGLANHIKVLLLATWHIHVLVDSENRDGNMERKLILQVGARGYYHRPVGAGLNELSRWPLFWRPMSDHVLGEHWNEEEDPLQSRLILTTSILPRTKPTIIT